LPRIAGAICVFLKIDDFIRNIGAHSTFRIRRIAEAVYLSQALGPKAKSQLKN
jgi:hypothetical protein